MSNSPENELDLDKLFLPAWAQEPASANLYAEYQGDDRGPREDRRGQRRGPGREGGRGEDGLKEGEKGGVQAGGRMAGTDASNVRHRRRCRKWR